MEFPDLGQHCSHTECHRLDFLPMKCDLCEKVFCLDHYRYASHSCPNAYEKDNQVPICPLCNQPVPVKRGELPDVRVGQHIDLDCESDPATKKRNQIYKNKCSLKGCKQKELVPLTCDDCGKNHCLKHRHPADHHCTPSTTSRIASKSGSAALKRLEQIRPNVQKPIATKASPQSVRSHSNTAFAVQGDFSEDEALARALQQSMLDNGAAPAVAGHSSDTQYDRDLAAAIAESQRNVTRNKDKCSVS